MASEATVATFIVECFWPGVRDEEVDQGARRIRRAAAGRPSKAGAVEFTGSVLLPVDEVVFFMFEGGSADAVREVCERADIPFERVVESVWKPAGHQGRERE